jgi:Tetratricopeptide repeat
MPPNSEIEKLERRWKENPKGTVFAPYAEVLRKHGDYPAAKDVLRTGLELHPDHIPGNIVLGRCCLDLGEEGPAEAAFVHVLDLDAENVIALKALADITERQGRLMEAAGWLNRLISVDPSNDEAREQRARVEKAREQASAALVEPPPQPVAPAPVSETERTVVVPVIQPPTPKALELEAETASAGAVTGEVLDNPEEPLAIDADAVVEAALGSFGAPSPPPPMPAEPDAEVTERVAARTPPSPEPSSTPADLGIVPAELDVAAMASEVESQVIADLTPDDPFAAPAAPGGPAGPPEAFALGLDEPASIDLRSSGVSEFQSSDDSTSLLDLRLETSTEFQQPNASEELQVSASTASEYQTPSGAEELLRSVETGELLESTRPTDEPPPPTSGFAAISIMPTEEIPTGPEGAGGTEAVEEEDTAAQSVVDMLAAAAPPSQDLPLIFPDEAGEPEPQKIRRISDEVGPASESEVGEGLVGEPAPVLTETMAELFVRQGHYGEALNVFHALAARSPDDERLAARIREVEAAQTAGKRRLSYVAVETGGESVESFFRTLSDARPNVGDEQPGTGRPGRASAAPTRPANDPLSLSAIFGDEPASTAANTTNPAPRPGGESFSFDQFFAGGGSTPAGTGPRASTPGDEDLDQFQNWLKSLKR